MRRKVWFEINDAFAIGEGGFDLLLAVASTGSLTRAATAVGWSYRHAWGYIRRAENILGVRLIEPVAGKGRARGTRLTSSAERLCSMMQKILAAVDQAIIHAE